MKCKPCVENRIVRAPPAGLHPGGDAAGARDPGHAGGHRVPQGHGPQRTGAPNGGPHANRQLQDRARRLRGGQRLLPPGQERPFRSGASSRATPRPGTGRTWKASPRIPGNTITSTIARASTTRLSTTSIRKEGRTAFSSETGIHRNVKEMVMCAWSNTFCWVPSPSWRSSSWCGQRLARTLEKSPERNFRSPNSCTALDAFKRDTGHYPTGTNGLLELVQRPPDTTNWHGPYLEFIPKDPWGHDYIYECPGKHNTNFFDLISLGPDGRLGTDDDIHN